ncbi:secondary thiamine-phosphate synthase enzyme YjbQ [Shewanella sp. HL-SH4]|uniref:secondary thiamine-phosphate synthase enzyme YjbQ n=1 Tax=Shewanella sp. HL-SH4 TaxID=3436240 RepID=UPI003EBF2394
MMWFQKSIQLTAKRRGFHLVEDELLQQLPELKTFEIGLAHFFIQHTSASLTLNENADPTVRGDFERHFNVMVPENAPYYRHTYEGADDMPAHIKSSLIGAELTIPISKGRLNLGTWQGIYLCEHRDQGSARNIIVTLNGQ